ncbi:hypothetical protein BVRB_6g141530 [Beta vulgaris subsp. vulgaris]|nr:hypothetical protein BVRB_6g141530 [Beta vulgaris subsp. vulgaris]
MHLPWLLFLSLMVGVTVHGVKALVTPTNMLTAANTTKPGCPRKCGNLTVPYPFGIGIDCSFDHSFSIICNTSNDPPKAFSVIPLGSSENPEILNITESQVMIWNSQIASKCYDDDGNVVSETGKNFKMLDLRFRYALTNKLRVVGCNDYAVVARKGLRSFAVTLSSLQNRSFGWKSYMQPCGYAFFGVVDRFSFDGESDLNGTVVNRTIQQVPLVLDWNVAPVAVRQSLSCFESQKYYEDYVYACQSNTECVDADTGGYRCKCLPGYEGNPYLEPGCTDIDECAAGSNSPCAMACQNTPGSYKCYCPSGYVGDGFRNGTNGCIKISHNSSSSLKKIVPIGTCISLGTMLLLFAAWYLYRFYQRKKIVRQKAKFFERNGGYLVQQQMSSDESVVARMKIFTSEELERATDNFNQDRILGQGGQETEVPLLVYEFILNGTLFHHIHYPSEEFPITWRMRLQIASDSVGALAYLHTSSSIPILHRDIKTSNILLDDKYRAKMSDFGTSKSIALDQTHVTTRVVGTFGYLDPEYFQSSQFTEKSDVYSFGVVLVELLTGQKAVRAAFEEDRSLTSWFLSHMETSRLLEIVDNQLLQEGSKEEFLTIANLARQCLNLDGRTRPTMKEVLINVEAVISLRFPQQNRLATEQVSTGATRCAHNDFLSSSAIYTENSFVNSAQLSLLFNPR